MEAPDRGSCCCNYLKREKHIMSKIKLSFSL
jgi:hypothetical protein